MYVRFFNHPLFLFLEYNRIQLPISPKVFKRFTPNFETIIRTVKSSLMQNFIEIHSQLLEISPLNHMIIAHSAVFQLKTLCGCSQLLNNLPMVQIRLFLVQNRLKNKLVLSVSFYMFYFTNERIVKIIM